MKRSSAPPGIEFILLLILTSFTLVAVAIAFGIARLLKKLFKVALRPNEIIVIAGLFILSFSASSLVIRQREEGMTVGFFGNPDRYEGAFLYYGLPEIWLRMFEPYDPSVRNLFLQPNNFYFYGFFVDFLFWLIVAVVTIYCVKLLAIRRLHG